MNETKFHSEINKPIPYGRQPFYYGKAKVAADCNLWAGKWKKIDVISDDKITLDGRGFSITEIDEFRLSREGLIRMFEEQRVAE